MARLTHCLAVIASLLTVGFAYSAEPGKPRTHHDVMRETVEYNRQTLTEPYRQIGKRDPKWDDAAIKFLDTVSVYWVNSSAPRLYRKPEPTAAQALALGEVAIEKGCDDPLVLYVFGRMLEHNDKSERGAEMIRKAYPGLVAGKYPPSRKYAVASAMRRLDPKSPDLETFNQVIADNIAAAIRGPFVNDAQRSETMASTQEQLKLLAPEARAEFYERITTQEGADPWIVGILGGYHHIEQAWAARGGGWADTVPEEGWRAFSNHLKMAEESLMKSLRARPHLPHGPTLMITVSMGRSDGSHRAWFDKAIAAQLDHGDAYSRIMNALLPRWGGSHVEMLEVGIQAARTQRYDTNAPYQLIYAISQVTRDSQRPGGKWDVWAHPDTYRLVTEVCTRYAETLTPDQGANWYRTFLAAVAWRIGKHDDARKLLDLAGDGELHAFGDVEAPGDLASSQIYGLTGPEAVEYAKAIELYDTRRYDDALALFKTIQGKLPADDKGRLYLSDRIFILDNADRFAAGEWVNLMPPAGLLSGWNPELGNWYRDKDGALLGYSDTRGLAMFYDLDFGRRYEIVANVEVLTQAPVQPRAGGIFFAFVDWNDCYGVWPDVAAGMVAVRHPGPRIKGVAAQLNKTNTIHATLWDTRITTTVNGQPINLVEQHFRDKLPTTRIGVGTFIYRQPGHSIRVHEIKIRKLDKEPGAAPAE